MEIRVKTVKPEVESKDWMESVRKQRRWDAVGTIVMSSTGHGLCYGVQHEDGVVAWYEPRELALV
jgi:hypothetical protein